jgi:iron complex outermembrane receptor protein
VYTLPAIVVRARRPSPQEILEPLPGQVSVVELAPLRRQMATAAEVLDELPGLHVSDYGSLGAFSTVSIRGSAPSQVSLYLDGVPLVRAGLGLTNLAELPFAAIERIEVYRGFAPPDLPGAGPGGAINLITRSAPHRGARNTQVVAGGGSFDTRRLGVSQTLSIAGLGGLLVADLLQSRGDFAFHDDNGTPLNLRDDEVVARQNAWLRSEEVLAKLARPLGGAGELRLVNQWVRRRQGVPGLSSFQSAHARSGATWAVTSLDARLPPVFGRRLQASARLFHDWRRDTFADPLSEIGLGYQDNRDVTRAVGGHLGLRARLPYLQALALDVEVRGERFDPWRRYPSPRGGPRQARHSLEAGLEQRLQFGAGRLATHAGLRLAHQRDRFAGDLRTSYSTRPARSGTRRDLEPRLGARLRLVSGVFAEASWGRYHRSPGFLELFGDGGSVAGSSDLVVEEGTNRDYGLLVQGAALGLRGRFEVAHFRNRVDHLITLLPQSQRTFVARNIGSARLHGEEWSWRLTSARQAPRWSLDGNYTRQRSTDLGVDIAWYAGKHLPGRPEHQLFQRLGLHLGAFEIGYEYEHLGSNWLDRWNRERVARRDLHGVDARAGWRGVSLQLGARNLGDQRVADVAGFPLPGRTFFATVGCDF